MYISKASASYCSLFVGVVLFALVVGIPSGRTVSAQPKAGEEPTGAPIFYNITPPEATTVSQDELSRASATIELRRDASLSSAEIYVDGQRRPEALAGPTTYLQTISADIEDLSPGIHTISVKALDSAGRAGGYVWQFTVI